MTTTEIVNRMMDIDMQLYEKILDTPIFAYLFNELVKKAMESDEGENK